jgi:hypothetical protein
MSGVDGVEIGELEFCWSSGQMRRPLPSAARP